MKTNCTFRSVNSLLMTAGILSGLNLSAFSQGNTNCIDTMQIDTNTMCPMLYAPVCGCDGVTYDNACFAQHFGGVTYWTQGECNTVGTCVASFTYAPNNIYMGVGWMIEFTDQSTGNPTSWTWDFGDGNSATGQNPYHVYMQAGTYQVCLTISDSANTCTDQFCDLVYVGQNNVQCYAYFSYYMDSTNLTFHFVDASSGNPSLWYWDFGDGNVTMQQSPVHTYASDGIYTVCLTVTDSNQMCSSTYCEQVQAGNSQNICYASFYYYPGQGNGNCVIFTDASQGNLTYWNWDFGDGTNETTQNPVHHYDSAGYYDVCLTVSDSSGNCVGTYCETIWVGSNTVPGGCYAYFYYYADFPDTTYSVHFTDASYGMNGTPTSWSWDFGDNTTSSDQNPYHVFPGPGYYYVCLTIGTDTNTMCQNSYCEYIYVGPVNQCWASFTFVPDSAGLGMTFINQSPGNTTSWYWDFGDGSSSTLQNPYHLFSDSGAYMVCLTISDSTMMNNNGGTMGCTSTACYTVFAGCSDSLMMLPSPQILVDSMGSGNVTGVCFSNGTGMNVTWSFADSSISNHPNPMFSFDSTGTYYICVNYTTQNGCSYVWCDSVFVMKTGIKTNKPVGNANAITVSPNPVSSVAKLVITVTEKSDVDLSVYNLLGEKVETIASGSMNSGTYRVNWNASDRKEGIYLLRLSTGGNMAVERISIVR